MAKKKKEPELKKKLDTSRIIDTASGWFAGAPSDVESLHVYFKPFRFKESKKPVVLSEFGGYSYKPEGHVFNPFKTYGYRFFADRQAFEDALLKLYEEEIIPADATNEPVAVQEEVIFTDTLPAIEEEAPKRVLPKQYNEKEMRRFNRQVNRRDEDDDDTI